MKKHIPNLITGMNVMSGTMAIYMAMYGYLELTALFILLGMIFDFFDGMAARLLHVKSELGKQLDSLADIVSFGVAPAVIAHILMKEVLLAGDVEAPFGELEFGQQVILLIPLLIPFFSAFRLAKFNLDTRQTHSFIGMPVPAHALFWVALAFASLYMPEIYDRLFASTLVLATCVVVLSLLLVSELPMFSLKISGFAWKDNRIRYLYFLTLLIIFLTAGRAVIVFIIPLYILFCATKALISINAKKRKK